MLQFSILGTSTKELYLPVRLQKAVINPLKHKTFVEGLTEGKGGTFLQLTKPKIGFS